MLSFLIPDYDIISIYQLPIAELQEKGIKALFFDIDNTVEAYDIREAGEKAKALFQVLKKQGFLLYLFSNNKGPRVRIFAKSLKIPYVSRAGKPLAGKLHKTLKALGVKKQEAAIVGDQLFTDVLCGKLGGVLTILTEPLTNRDQWITKIKRPPERILLSYLRKARDRNAM